MTTISTIWRGARPWQRSGSSNNATSPGSGRSLHRFVVAWVITTFVLVILGGTVTSRGVGLSVPDWPATFGYPMFRVPWAMWIGCGGRLEYHQSSSVVALAFIAWLLLRKRNGKPMTRPSR